MSYDEIMLLKIDFPKYNHKIIPIFFLCVADGGINIEAKHIKI